MHYIWRCCLIGVLDQSEGGAMEMVHHCDVKEGHEKLNIYLPQ